MHEHAPSAPSWTGTAAADTAGTAILVDPSRDLIEAERGRTRPAEARPHLCLLEEVDRAADGGPAIAILCWPDDRDEAARLARRGAPRLLVIGPTAPPVHQRDEVEDWVRLPVTDQDVCVRLRTLRYRAAQRPARPWLDGSGRLMFQDRWVALSETEERLAGVLIERLGHVVPMDELLKGGWPAGPPGEEGFRPMISRLRRRCAKVGLEITTVRGRGYGIHLTGQRGSTPT